MERDGERGKTTDLQWCLRWLGLLKSSDIRTDANGNGWERPSEQATGRPTRQLLSSLPALQRGSHERSAQVQGPNRSPPIQDNGQAPFTFRLLTMITYKL